MGVHDFADDVNNCHLTATISSPSGGFVAGQGLSISLNGVNLHATCDWSYKLDSWPHVPDGSGSLDATAGGGTAVDATIDVAIVGGKVVLTVASININIDDFDISIHGSIFSWLYDIIVDAFKGDIKNEISDAASNAIKSIIETTLNQVRSESSSSPPPSSPSAVAQRACTRRSVWVRACGDERPFVA
jgi:hypothetical protein